LAASSFIQSLDLLCHNAIVDANGLQQQMGQKSGGFDIEHLKKQKKQMRIGSAFQSLPRLCPSDPMCSDWMIQPALLLRFNQIFWPILGNQPGFSFETEIETLVYGMPKAATLLQMLL